MANHSSSEDFQYLMFRMAGEDYAIRILQVKEIIAYDCVTRVPGTPSWIRGVINLRGAVVPVVDLALKFSLSASDITRTSCIVIVEVNMNGAPAVMGVLADSVDEVLSLPQHDVEPPPPFGPRVSTDFLFGIGKIAGKFVLLLDIDRVLSCDELLQGMSAGELVANSDVPQSVSL